MVFPVYWMVSTAFKPGNDVLSYTPHWLPDFDARELPRRDRAPVLLGQREEQPDRRRRRRAGLGRAGVPRRPGAREVPLLRPPRLRGDHLRRADGAARGADHPALHHAQPRAPGRHAHRRDRHLHRVRPARSASGRCAASSPASRRSSRRRRWSTARPASAPSCGSCSRSSRPASSRLRSSRSSRPGTSTSSPTSCSQSQEKQTLTIWLANFTTLRGTDWGSLMAGATLTALPVVVFFVLVHRRIAFGLTAGAVKS